MTLIVDIFWCRDELCETVLHLLILEYHIVHEFINLLCCDITTEMCYLLEHLSGLCITPCTQQPPSRLVHETTKSRNRYHNWGLLKYILKMTSSMKDFHLPRHRTRRRKSHQEKLHCIIIVTSKGTFTRN